MRINRIQSDNVNFSALQVNYADSLRFREKDIMHYKDKLANTKVFDVVIDSHGLALKEKMTDVLHRIQSFSLFPKENSIAVNLIGEKKPLCKFKYSTIEKAEAIWEKLSNISKTKNSLEEYAIVTLWLDKCLRNKK